MIAEKVCLYLSGDMEGVGIMKKFLSKSLVSKLLTKLFD